jgi:cellulose synthase/poly-beta-1,6-N-acetylglucosamine synthase-like glycosyltransferase
MTVVEIVFWVSAGLIVYTQVGYPLLLAVLARILRRSGPAEPQLTRPGELPKVSAIVAAYNEQDVIAARVANLRALAYPSELLEVVIASDGSTDSTAAHARAAGADIVLELPRGGKIRAQDASVEQAGGEILAFSDANSEWQPDALAEVVSAESATSVAT